MDIERLTKAQIVLLTLLVSFITSIATGIITVTLMDQAPSSVTQVINRVVERTVETVVPSEGNQGASAGESIKEVTVVVKENDLITESIDKNAKTLARISIYQGRNSTEPGEDVALGVMVSPEGVVLADATLLGNERYVVTTSDGAHYIARRTNLGEGTTLGYLRLDSPGATFPSVELGRSTTAKLGQTAITLSGKERVNVALGSITEIEMEADIVTRIHTDIAVSRIAYGSPLFNMFGEVLGFYTRGSGSEGGAVFVPLAKIPTDVVSAEVN
jgi:S1-C subfamily serine protease